MVSLTPRIELALVIEHGWERDGAARRNAFGQIAVSRMQQKLRDRHWLENSADEKSKKNPAPSPPTINEELAKVVKNPGPDLAVWGWHRGLLHGLFGVPASNLAFAGRADIVPVVGSSHGHALAPKNAGFAARYIELGMAKPAGVLCQRCEFVRKS